MARIDQNPLFRVRCPGCGHRELTAVALRLVVPASGRAFYAFRCPGCARSVRRPAGPRVVALLTAGGVPSVRVHAS